MGSFFSFSGATIEDVQKSKKHSLPQDYESRKLPTIGQIYGHMHSSGKPCSVENPCNYISADYVRNVIRQR